MREATVLCTGKHQAAGVQLGQSAQSLELGCVNDQVKRREDGDRAVDGVVDLTVLKTRSEQQQSCFNLPDGLCRRDESIRFGVDMFPEVTLG